MNSIFYVIAIAFALLIFIKFFLEPLVKEKRFEKKKRSIENNTLRDDQGEEFNEFPFVYKKYLLSKAELSFAKVMESAVGNKLKIAPKVRMLDVFLFESGINRSEWQTGFNKISRKHFDFILYYPESYQIYAAVELDDKSHNEEERRERDIFVEKACEKAGLNLFRFQAQYEYSPKEISDKIFGDSQNKSEEIEPAPFCSKCGAVMVKKRSSNPKYAGKIFWACPKYPECKNVIPIN
ncbi:MAG: DUF2726 domain-containing protein [Desulfobulbus sp.]|jgi:hypothetical protein